MYSALHGGNVAAGVVDDCGPQPPSIGCHSRPRLTEEDSLKMLLATTSNVQAAATSNFLRYDGALVFGFVVHDA